MTVCPVYWLYGNKQKSSEKSSNITIYFYNKEQGNDFILKETSGSEVKPIEFKIPFYIKRNCETNGKYYKSIKVLLLKVKKSQFEK